LVILLGIPGDADLRSEILVGLPDAAAQARAELVDEIAGTSEQGGGGTRNRREIAVGAAGVANVTQADRQRKIGFHLPGVTNVKLYARVGRFPAWETEAGTLGEKALPV